MAPVHTPSSRRHPTVPPLADLDAPGRRPVRAARAGGEPGAPLWTPRTGEDADEQAAAAQRAVADERAAVARAVLAERAAAASAGDGRTPGPLRRWTVAGYPAPVALGLAALLVALRLWLVGSGALFGTGPVRALDAAVAATVLLALALALSREVAAKKVDRGVAARRLAVVLAVPVLVLAGLTLVAPATPASAPAAGCPTAPVRGAPFVAVTAADAGAHSGPGRSYATTGRFPTGCAVGFAGYCLGDPVPNPTWPSWADRRWLLVDRRADGPAALVARHLSGEPAAPRFLPSAVVAAADPEDALPQLSTAECGREGLRVAGQVSLDDVVPGPIDSNLSARVTRAANVGFARWVAPDPTTGVPPLLRGESYQQITGVAADRSDHPGATGPSGRRTVSWNYRSLIRDLDTGRRTREATVAVLAVGCEAPSVPAAAETAALTTYSVVGVRLSGPERRLTGKQVPTAVARGQLRGLDLRRLTKVACQSPL